MTLSCCRAHTRSHACSWTPPIPAPSLPPEDPTRPLLFEALGQSVTRQEKPRSSYRQVPEREPLVSGVDSLFFIDELILRHTFPPKR